MLISIMDVYWNWFYMKVSVVDDESPTLKHYWPLVTTMLRWWWWWLCFGCGVMDNDKWVVFVLVYHSEVIHSLQIMVVLVLVVVLVVVMMIVTSVFVPWARQELTWSLLTSSSVR